MLYDELRQRDLQHIWHPYSPIASLEQSAFPIIGHAAGVKLYTVDNKAILDGISSWWCVNLGHSHPRLLEALARQSRLLQHSILGGLSHPPVIALSEELFQVTPPGLQHVLWASDGSSSVEAALKVALQYWQMQGQTDKTEFISLEAGYHGDTIGVLSVGYVATFHRFFQALLPSAHKAPSPHCAACPWGRQPGSCSLYCLAVMEELLYSRHERLAAVIVEPLCQAAGGMRIYPARYLTRLGKLCRELNILLIVDEVATGFWRTGTAFACEQADLEPDMMVIGKGLTAGYLPMSGLLVTPAIFNAFRNTPSQDRTFYHGHTFCGNPLAAAVALEALRLYREPEFSSNLTGRISQLQSGIDGCGRQLADSPAQSLGLIGKVLINAAAGGAVRAQAITKLALEKGLFIRSLGDVIYLWPPLTTTESELAAMFAILQGAIRDTADCV